MRCNIPAIIHCRFVPYNHDVASSAVAINRTRIGLPYYSEFDNREEKHLPMIKRIESFVSENPNNPSAQMLVEQFKIEIEQYQLYGDLKHDGSSDYILNYNDEDDEWVGFGANNCVITVKSLGNDQFEITWTGADENKNTVSGYYKGLIYFFAT